MAEREAQPHVSFGSSKCSGRFARHETEMQILETGGLYPAAGYNGSLKAGWRGMVGGKGYFLENVSIARKVTDWKFVCFKIWIFLLSFKMMKIVNGTKSLKKISEAVYLRHNSYLRTVLHLLCAYGVWKSTLRYKTDNNSQQQPTTIRTRNKISLKVFCWK